MEDIDDTGAPRTTRNGMFVAHVTASMEQVPKCREKKVERTTAAGNNARRSPNVWQNSRVRPISILTWAAAISGRYTSEEVARHALFLQNNAPLTPFTPTR